jgi:amino acid permease
MTGYLMIPVFVALYLGHKSYNHTRVVPLNDCNFELE